MNVFMVLAILVASQWPGDWTTTEVQEASLTILREEANQLQTRRVGGWICVAHREMPEASPVCAKGNLEKVMEDALETILKAQNRLIEE